MNYLAFIIPLLISISGMSQSITSLDSDKEIEFINLFSTADNSDVACYRIPALITAPNGDILAAIDERVPDCGDLRTNEDINLVLRRSQDNGASWTEIETIVDYPFGQSASDPSFILDAQTGELFLFFNFMDLKIEKDVYYLRVMKSSDNGLNWSEPMDITSQISKPEWHHDFKFITSGRGIQTNSGKLVHTLVNLNHSLHLFESDDHGKTWKFIDTPIKPANESKVMERADGSWMINSRVRGKGLRYVHISNDQGRTWRSKADSTLLDPACNASFIRYTSVNNGFDKNRILFSNANNLTKRENLTVRISYDEGLTWNKGKTIYSGGSAYSSLTVLQNGDIGVFFEKDDYQENAFVRFSLEWLSDGEDRIEDKP